MFGIGVPELIVLAIIGLVFVWPFWRIFSRAGFSGWWSFTMIIPIVGTVTLFYLAFADWPALHEQMPSRRYREKV
ncbi:hypothetical protein [Desulfobacula sp.]|uniref:hypothetical protein n=1 Tax=Desulfobacula sp. TaxID=2593537 RepID=UPI0026146F5A|nr:hypothetical protein [Desulfobacula sp.]